MLRGNIYYGNRYTYQTGNPFLKPIINQDLIFSASYKWVNFSFTYNRTKDDIIQVCEPYSEADPTISLLKKKNRQYGTLQQYHISYHLIAYYQLVESAAYRTGL